MIAAVDTNVLFAAFVSREGRCARLVEALIEGHTLVSSEFILGELAEKLTTKRGLDARLVDQQVDFVRDAAVLVTPAPLDRSVFSDVDDLPVLGTAVAAGADCLVTGDRALRRVGRIGESAVLTPAELAQLLAIR